jgi:hypothetical protein
MSNKELVADLVQRLPEEASLLDIAREIEFIAGARRFFLIGPWRRHVAG